MPLWLQLGMSIMMTGLTPIQMANWQMLLMLATAAKADLIGTCCSYRIERHLVERILEMTPLELMTHVLNVGDESLFAARVDLGEIFTVPLPLSEAMLSVKRLDDRPHEPAPRSLAPYPPVVAVGPTDTHTSSFR